MAYARSDLLQMTIVQRRRQASPVEAEAKVERSVVPERWAWAVPDGDDDDVACDDLPCDDLPGGDDDDEEEVSGGNDDDDDAPSSEHAR